MRCYKLAHAQLSYALVGSLPSSPYLFSSPAWYDFDFFMKLSPSEDDFFFFFFDDLSQEGLYCFSCIN